MPTIAADKIDALLSGYSWSASPGTAKALQYSFLSTVPYYYAPGDVLDFASFSTAEQQWIQQALVSFSEVANISFAEASGSLGDLTFGRRSQTAAGVAFYPPPFYTTGQHADVWMGNAFLSSAGLAPGTVGFETLLHELGHAIGLKHPFEPYPRPASSILFGAEATTQYTIMAYDAHQDMPSVYASGPLLYDIAALQHLYGANMTTRVGDDTYTFSTTGPVLKAIWDAGGSDTLSAAGQAVGAVIDLREGQFSSIGVRVVGGELEIKRPAKNNIAIAFGAVIENAVGTAQRDLLVGNQVANELQGGAGADVLDGGLSALAGLAPYQKGQGDGAADTLVGGDGIDRYVLRSGGGVDRIRDAGFNVLEFRDLDDEARPELSHQLWFFASGVGMQSGANTDGSITYMINSPLTLTAPDINVAVLFESFSQGDFGIRIWDALPAIALTGITKSGDLTPAVDPPEFDALGNVIVSAVASPNRADTLYDSTASDELLGLGGDDVLNAFRGGDDILRGGAGADWIFGGVGGDLLEGGSEGDRLFGGDGRDQLFGNVGASMQTLVLSGRADANAAGWLDLLSGGAGDDLLFSQGARDFLAGGAGDDLLIGGAGDDHFQGDLDITYAAPVWQVIETQVGSDYTYTFSGIEGTYFSGSDMVYAGNGDDRGQMGGGDDTVFGENGVDKFWGDGGADTLLGGEGADLLHGDNSATYVPVIQHGEDFIDGGNGADTLYGGGASDTIYGGADNDYIIADEATSENAGNDFVDAGSGADEIYGGAGADTLYGGVGDDIIRGDFVDSQLASQYHGADMLDGGDGADLLYGNGGADTLYGGAGDDYLRGDNADVTSNMQLADMLDGGSGQDTLVGDGGDDVLDGGADNDELDGGLGDDRYMARAGEGRDTIFEETPGNVLVMLGRQQPLFNGVGIRGQLASGAPSASWISVREPDTGGQFFLLDVDDATSVLIANGPQGVISSFEINGTVSSASLMVAGALRDSLSVLASDPSGQTLYGGRGGDSLRGAAGADVLEGAGGPDSLRGNAGDDTLLGGDGDDILYGDDGDDVLQGGAGDDYLYGYGSGGH